jgi:hypothetical protein
MIQNTHFFRYALLFAVVFFTLPIYGKAASAPQATLWAEATFYVH